MKKLKRSKTDRVISGVCAGWANYLGIDTSVMRILWALSLFVGGIGVIAYIVCLFIMPEEDEDDRDEQTTSIRTKGAAAL